MDDQIRQRLDQGRYEEAFELLLRTYQNKVFHLAFAILRDQALAEETAQEVFLRLWKGLGGYRGHASLSTWIYAVARNTALTALRAKNSRPALPLDEAAGTLETWRPERPERASADVLALVRELPDHYRQVVTLFYLEEKSYEEVSRLLDLPMGTIKTYLHRARKTLLASAGRVTIPDRES